MTCLTHETGGAVSAPGKNQRTRIAYLDFLKVAGVYAVVLTHVTATLFSIFPLGSAEWAVVDLLDGISRWAVPCFLMVSGALMLDEHHERPAKDLWLRRILPFVALYFIWSTFYAVYHAWMEGWPGWRSFFLGVIRGEYHLWYLPMFVVVTAMLPVLRAIARSKPALIYSCAFFVVSLFTSYVPLFSGGALGGAVGSLVSDAHVPLCYAGYCLVGYLLSRLDLPACARAGICLGGVIGLLVTVAGTFLLSVQGGGLVHLYDNLTPNVFACAVAVFVFARKGRRRPSPSLTK
ncbi:acyltransferase [Olsenella profusa]|uniref:Acyltransferase family protein n=1 Tax=Olsenella profusa TaxID=138595 RepID=A0ABS2F1V5_9ACTN|nr:acyltransferase family protein [Olsenella profusa]MBM6774805.1 acyltransferase family protein [Olsenella profusa]